MSKRSVLVVDDEEHGRVLVKQYLKAHDHFFVAGECHNGLEAIKYINGMEPDLVFLDIQMPGADGFEVLQRIEHVPRIIFTTAFDQYAIKAFEINAVDYLLKPYTRERFDNAMTRLNTTPQQLSSLMAEVTATRGSYPERIMVEHKKRYQNIPVAAIIYMKANRDYTEVHTASGSYLSTLGISIIEGKFDPAKFIRIHRSVIVNMDHVQELYRDAGKTLLVMDNGLELNVGRNYLGHIKNLII
ncbi:LytTR family DNA-binding domain-containing protein [Niabella pedocola]|uniref:LytTR family DNA-binding domain-containing protein n=1 Tax=Niabella pedocola TaxID=1752077 RepID=A0ABS8PSV0_9BACT|nr:LytTR family DNA-binding domain-containing protein [Niabella pedocola]MCD2423955.1 LytTR family DNA-binding domain-containing protein [Niabella pedocola]